MTHDGSSQGTAVACLEPPGYGVAFVCVTVSGNNAMYWIITKGGLGYHVRYGLKNDAKILLDRIMLQNLRINHCRIKE
jgi:hypothetical protein